MLCAEIAFALVGLGFSIFYGQNAVDIFIDTDNEFAKKKMKVASWRFHQRWLNFIGSAAGWAAAYYFIFGRVLPVSSFSFKLEDSVLIIIALLGLGGFLPNALSRVTSFKG
jgi:hypothetical protein